MSKGVQTSKSVSLPEILAKYEPVILEQWIREMSVATRRADLIKDSELGGQCSSFLQLLRQGAESDDFNIDSAAWQPLREQLAEISKNRAQQGFTPTETATFVLS